ncbi:hypothetical protein SEVIR_1G210400v4 [Setaria viridis]|uniref:Granulins domain-containing protein n=1 Tax=Setaria viridis TaxID=4556 RepID=A0A4U6WCV0_SETVI|nr:hypothetical protein SEVIR_1G210400v2 [Setaria viridis]
MGFKIIVGALVLALLVMGAAEAQILPTPCCRIDCCDGKPECCAAGPYMAAVDYAAAATSPTADVDGVVVRNARARPAGAGRKVGAGN